MRRALSDVQGCRERLGFAAVSQCKIGHLAKARCYPKSMLAEWRLHVLGMLSLNKYKTRNSRDTLLYHMLFYALIFYCFVNKNIKFSCPEKGEIFVPRRYWPFVFDAL